MNAETIGTNVAETHVLVSEASLAAGQTYIILKGGTQVPVSEVTALRAPIE